MSLVAVRLLVIVRRELALLLPELAAHVCHDISRSTSALGQIACVSLFVMSAVGIHSPRLPPTTGPDPGPGFGPGPGPGPDLHRDLMLTLVLNLILIATHCKPIQPAQDIEMFLF